jgi:lipopolysaccharide biosynthesis glycosyltransferase
MNYLPHLSALIASVLSNANKSKHIDYIILDGGISAEDRKRLKLLEKLHPNTQISFIDMSMSFLDVKMSSYFTRATLYRLILPDIITNRKKIIFLDTDMIVLDDISNLFDIDLGGKAIAAVRDLIMQTFVTNATRSSSVSGSKPAIKYLSEYLELGDDYPNYFQAGVIVFDLEKLRTLDICNKMLLDIKNNLYWFFDQDLLNKYFVRNVLYLDHKWNCVYLSEKSKELLITPYLEYYMESCENPSIIHYAGTEKPWNSFNTAFSYYYWYYLRMTSWYEQVAFKSGTDKGKHLLKIRCKKIMRTIALKLWVITPFYIKEIIYPFVNKIKRYL